MTAFGPRRPRTGSVPIPRSPRHGTPRTTRAVVGATLVIAATLLAAGATAAPPAGAQPAPALRLAGQTPFVAPQDVLDIDLAATDAPTDAGLRFELYASLTVRGGRNRIDENLLGRGFTDDARLARRGPIPLDALERPTPETVRASFFVVPADPVPFDRGFRIAEPGVYPLVITLTDPAGGDLAKMLTYVVRLPDAATATRSTGRGGATGELPLQVATVATLAAPPALRPDGTTDLPAGQAGALSATVDALADHSGVALTVAPVPETVDALATGPANGTAKVSRLAGALGGRELLASPYVRLDVDAWVASGMAAALGGQLKTGADALAARLPTAPQPERRTWVSGAPMTSDAVAALRTFGVDRLVLPPSALAPADPRTPVTTTTQARPVDVSDGAGGTVRTMLLDEQATRRLGQTGQPALDTQLFLADLAVVSLEQPDVPRAVVTRLPESTSPAAAATLERVLSALDRPTPQGGRPLLEPVTLERAFRLEPATAGATSTPVVRTLAPVPAVADLGTYPERLPAAELSLDGYRSMVAATAPDRLPPLRRRLDVSGAASLDPGGRDAYLDSVTGEIGDQARNVRPPREDEGVTLAANEAQLPLVMENRNADALTVRVVLVSDKLEFPDGNVLVPTLQPGTNRLVVNVRVRASGSFPLDVRLSSPDGRITMASSRINVRSTAVSGLGLVLSIAAGVFLLVWWARHFRSARRARKLVRPDQLRSADPTVEGGRWPESESSPTAPAT